MAKLSKEAWLYKYSAVIQRRLKGCTKRPKWQHLPAGHMRFEQKMSPTKAATAYLTETSWVKSCARKKR